MVFEKDVSDGNLRIENISVKMLLLIFTFKGTHRNTLL